MPRLHTAGSFTKNFGWNESYEKLHLAIRKGFSLGLSPTQREDWRKRSEIRDPDRELIPLNFFLYTTRGLNDDFIMVDRLAERAKAPYDADFPKLALFVFHLATSGNWHKSKWSDGKVAGWANEFIRTVAWNNGSWSTESFTEQSLKSFLDERIDGERVTKRKVLTNYRYMLTSAGVLVNDKIQPVDLRAPWLADAAQLFWDRQIFSGELSASSQVQDFESAFFRHEIHKLIACTPEQGRVIALGTYRVYVEQILPSRLEQLKKIRARIAA